MNVDIFSGYGIEVTLKSPEDFLKVKETLTRMGKVDDPQEKILSQSCHILHKQGRYVIIHFRELYALDGGKSKITDDDLARRNTIADLLSQWELISILHPEKYEDKVPIRQIRILNFKEKHEWKLEAKYSFWKKEK